MVEVPNALAGDSADKANISTLADIPRQYMLDRLQLPTSDTPALRLVTPRSPAGSRHSGWDLSALAGASALRLDNPPALRLENTPALRLENTPALRLVIPQHSGW